jgi:hypothetical protein
MTTKPRKILMVAPSFPYPESGAEQADRAAGIRQLVRLGHQVTVIAKVTAWADKAELARVAASWGVKLVTVPYRYSNRKLSQKEKFLKLLGRLRNPLYMDGAAYEYSEPEIKAALVRELETDRPDVVWFEYTYLWPLYRQVRRARLPIVTRSVNFEPQHFLEEDGRSALNLLKYAAKYWGERRTIRLSTRVLAITPKEQAIYRPWGVEAQVLPLRSLPLFLSMPRPAVRTATPLHVCFMGSSFSVSHNRAAAEHIIEAVAPEAELRAPGAFVFHIFGGKLPDDLRARCNGTTVVYEGYVTDLNTRLAEMDIAVVPSLYGAGMQQKVFEPIARGMPTITSPRAIAGYAFEPGVHYVAAEHTQAFVDALVALQPRERRAALSAAALLRAKELFSQDELDAIVQSTLL